MLNGKSIAVVICAFNEEKQIGYVLENMPEYVDRIVVVDDGSRDSTVQQVESYRTRLDQSPHILEVRTVPPGSEDPRYGRADLLKAEIFEAEGSRLTPQELIHPNPKADRLVIIRHLKNAGKGAALASGLQWCRSAGIACTVTMDGDGQMDPGEIRKICDPVVFEDVDYVKGNRLNHRAAMRVVPPVRYFGNSVLSILTKIASGYWKVWDAQTGFTAISLYGLESIQMDRIYQHYGVPNDMLVKMNTANCTLREVSIRPVYRVGEKSKMRILLVIPKISMLLLRLFFQRLWKKYFLTSFHPLFLLYHLGIGLMVASVPLFLQIFYQVLWLHRKMPVGNYLAFVLIALVGFQSLLFAMWMDIQDNATLLK